MVCLIVCSACRDGNHEKCDGGSPAPPDQFGGSICTCSCKQSKFWNHETDSTAFMLDSQPEHLITFTISGSPPRKSNSRQTLKSGRSIKSKKALDYEVSFMQQATRLKLNNKDFNVPMKMVATVYYSSKLSDLSDELIADCMEKCGLIRNDNLIREKNIVWAFDKEDPRTELALYTIPGYIMEWIPNYKSKEEKLLCQMKKKRKK